MQRDLGHAARRGLASVRPYSISDGSRQKRSWGQNVAGQERVSPKKYRLTMTHWPFSSHETNHHRTTKTYMQHDIDLLPTRCSPFTPSCYFL